ncbi:MAG: transposase [Armatimonadetes bacterium]|nr:transposase [Armatimonadota bacterium]
MNSLHPITPQAALSLLALQTPSFLERPARRIFSPAFKRAVCRQVARGAKRPSEICREHLLKEAVLRRWSIAYQLHGDGAFAPRKEKR